jgi:hypothetical protein
MNLILSTPSIEYAQAVSHELWMLARPRGYSDNETSQYYCGTFAHPDGTKVAIGPIDGKQNVHKDADEVAFVDIIRAALTEGEALALTNVINTNKGGKVTLTDIITATPSLAPNLITREEMQADGWFPEVDEV